VARESFQRLRKLLDELFQFDRADLDFGLYRIMNRKREEIGRFLDEELLPQVREALGSYRSTERETLQTEIEEQERNLRSLGMNEVAVSDVPAIRDLRNKLVERADAASIENRIYSDLYTFFSRYYKDGDFVSLRRYKPGVYAIPYEGEEVKLYWANADQYYVKSSENFQDYRFVLPDGRQVHFTLVAAETERDNNKASNGHERRFVLRSDEPIEEISSELKVYFEYRPSEERQAKINDSTVKRLMELSDIDTWRAALGASAPTGGNANRSVLEKQLADYTARNSFDYFIHKDLGGFLRRELDFFLKNEVLHVDDLDTDDERRATQYLARLRAIKQVGFKIIDFLAQLEDFQKKLWLKQKFVLTSNYCVTLDRVPAELYTEIIANNAQRLEWVKLFAIEEIKVDTTRSAGYSEPLTDEFLRENPYLVLDTKYFGEDFKARLLASFSDLDAALDGVLIKSENFQALHLVHRVYRGRVKCIYIDPPYNIGSDDFLYKDNYQHSSWLAMMEDRLRVANGLLSAIGAIFVSINNREQPRLQLLMDSVFGPDDRLATISVAKGTTTGQDASKFGSSIDYLLAYRKSENFLLGGVELSPGDLTRFDKEDELGAYSLLQLRKTGNNDRREDRENLYYPLIAPDGSPVYPIGPTGYESRWRASLSTVKRWQGEGLIEWLTRPDGYVPYVKYYAEGRTKRPSDLWRDVFSGDDELLDEVEGNKKATIELKSLFGYPTFQNPKPTDLVRQVLGISKCILSKSRGATPPRAPRWRGPQPRVG